MSRSARILCQPLLWILLLPSPPKSVKLRMVEEENGICECSLANYSAATSTQVDTIGGCERRKITPNNSRDVIVRTAFESQVESVVVL